jgi:hypothetical protein
MHIETLTLTTNDATHATINFSVACNGTGPVFASTPAPSSIIEFGTVQAGSATAVGLIEITNSAPDAGKLTVSISSSSLQDSSWFSISSSTLLPAQLGVDTITLVVTCSPPLRAFGSHNESLVLATNDATAVNVTYILRCNASGPVLHTSPLEEVIEFGRSNGESWQLISVSNTGTASMQVLPISISSGMSSWFSVVPANTSMTLAASSVAYLNVTCAPTSSGSVNETLTVATIDAANRTYTLRCTAAPKIATQPAGLVVEFGQVESAATSGVQQIVVSNQAFGVLQVNSTSALQWFTVVDGLPIVALEAQSANISITCRVPNSTANTGEHTEALVLSTNDPTQASVAYTLRCTAIAALFVSMPAPASTIEFGAIQVATTRSIVVSNAGNASLHVEGSLSVLTAAGASSSNITISSAPVLDVGSLGNASIAIACAPGSAFGMANLTLATNDPLLGSVWYTIKCGVETSVVFNPSGDTLSFVENRRGRNSSLPVEMQNQSATPTAVRVEVTGDTAAIFAKPPTFSITIDAWSNSTVEFVCSPLDGFAVYQAQVRIMRAVDGSTLKQYTLLCATSASALQAVPVRATNVTVHDTPMFTVSTPTPLTFSNNGTTPIRIVLQQRVSVNASLEAHATLVWDQAQGVTLSSGGTVSFALACIPVVVGIQHEELQVTANDETFVYRVSCNGSVSVVFEPAVDRVGVGAITAGGAATTQRISVRNTLPSKALTLSLSISRVPPTKRTTHAVEAAAAAIRRTTVAAMETTVSVVPNSFTLAPQSVQDIVISVATSQIGESTALIALHAPGMLAPVPIGSLNWIGTGSKLVVNPAWIDFGSVVIGNSVRRLVSLGNSGNTDLRLDQVVLLQNSGAHSFVVTDLLAASSPLVAPGATVLAAIEVVCMPQQVGNAAATILLRSNDAANAEVAIPLTCQGTASCSDGLRNQGESGVDCGGPCPACQREPVGGDQPLPPDTMLASPIGNTGAPSTAAGNTTLLQAPPTIAGTSTIPTPITPTPVVASPTIVVVQQQPEQLMTVMTGATTASSGVQQVEIIDVSTMQLLGTLNAPATIDVQNLLVQPVDTQLVAQANQNSPGLAENTVLNVVYRVNGQVCCTPRIGAVFLSISISLCGTNNAWLLGGTITCAD